MLVLLGQTWLMSQFLVRVFAILGLTWFISWLILVGFLPGLYSVYAH